MIQELHEGHPGMSRMKALARMYLWWPGIDNEIEKSVCQCAACQEVQSSPPQAPLNPWKWPTRPWARLHLDYAGPFENKMILVLIDAHSKWIEACCTPNATSKAVIAELRPIFARFGVPETIVTDNGTCFVSEEFEHFLSQNGIKHSTSAPYHPASNGLAERAVQIVKRGLKKERVGDMRSRLAKTLLTYRVTPQSTTGVSPSELLLGRRPRTRLDLLKPNLADRVEEKQNQQKVQHDAKAKSRVFSVGDAVYVKNHTPGRRWSAGRIERVTGPVSFEVKMEDGRIRRCHQDQIRQRVAAPDTPPVPEQQELESETPDLDIPIPASEPSDTEPETTEPEPPDVEPPPTMGNSPVTDPESDTPTRADPPTPPVNVSPGSRVKVYPRRNRTTVDRYEPTF